MVSWCTVFGLACGALVNAPVLSRVVVRLTSLCRSIALSYTNVKLDFSNHSHPLHSHPTCAILSTCPADSS